MKQLEEHITVMNASIDEKQIQRIASVIVKCLQSANKIMLIGNGGSAADAQHVAAEFVGRFMKDRAPMAAIALTTDTSILTSISNDISFDYIFSRQIKALGKEGDVLLAISTSGSKNVLAALNYAKTHGIVTVGLTGLRGRASMSICDELITVQSDQTARIQECHEFILHVICGMVEDEMSML